MPRLYALARGPAQHVLNFAGDDVALRETRVFKNSAKYPFGEEVLDEHLLNGRRGEVRVDGGLTELVEGGEIGAKLRVRAVLRFDKFGGFGAEFGNDILEACDGGVPLGGMGAFVSEKRLEDGDECFRCGDVRVHYLATVLIENCAFGSLEEDVLLRIADIELLLHFGVQIALNAFCLPGAAG